MSEDDGHRSVQAEKPKVDDSYDEYDLYANYDQRDLYDDEFEAVFTAYDEGGRRPDRPVLLQA
ncbi:hypothetical protein DVH05_021640 [Phytophthora capsici]|nr:hypothetical protein DVH05_021640 [Phytophthora capsici]